MDRDAKRERERDRDMGKSHETGDSDDLIIFSSDFRTVPYRTVLCVVYMCMCVCVCVSVVVDLWWLPNEECL